MNQNQDSYAYRRMLDEIAERAALERRFTPQQVAFFDACDEKMERVKRHGISALDDYDDYDDDDD